MFQGLSLDQAPPLSVPLRFFLTAPLFAILGGLHLALFGADLLDTVYSGPVIAWVHLWTLGWLAMVMFGAYYQMIPVMIGGQVPLPGLSGWIHGALLVGVVLFFGFFTAPQFFPAWMAGLTLGLGVGAFVLQIAWALWRVQGESRPTLSAMRLSLVSLAVTWGLGLWLLAGHAGWGPSIHGTARDLHLTFALLGWVGMLIIGVSFHLVPMFYITPHFETAQATRILRLMSLALAGSAVVLLLGGGHWALGFPVLFGLAGFVLYLF